MFAEPVRLACRIVGIALVAGALAVPSMDVHAAAGAARKHKVAPPPQRKAAAARDATPVPLVAPVASDDARRLLDWVVTSHDNGGLPYAVIDKRAASLLVFDGQGGFRGQVPVLLGIGVGDDSSPGVGAKSLADIGPAERTTPAGRFVAKFGRAFGNQRVLWVDYANSVALHAVLTTHRQEHRVERLQSPQIDDNRITFGCINVATDFYTATIRPLFQRKGGIVYILPDTKTMDDVFPRLRLLPYMNAVVPVAAGHDAGQNTASRDKGAL